MDVNLDSKNAWKSLVFSVAATLQLANTALELSGTFSTQGDFALAAVAYNFDWKALNSLYYHFFGEDLSAPDFDFSIQYLSIAVSRDEGLQIRVQGLRVGKHAAGEGFLSFDSTGGYLRASLNEANIPLGDMKVEKAFVEVSFTRGKEGSSTSFMLGGQVEWLDQEIEVAAHLYSIPGDRNVHYTVFGRLSTVDGKGFCLADHVPGLENSCFSDISLTDAAILIASRDDTEFASALLCPYTFKKGLSTSQVIARIEEC